MVGGRPRVLACACFVWMGGRRKGGGGGVERSGPVCRLAGRWVIGPYIHP